MYRNIVYKIGPDTGWKGKIYLWTWDNEGNPVQQEYSHESKLYVESANGKDRLVSQFDKPLECKRFDSIISRKRWINNNPGVRLFDCWHPEREFLIDNFGGRQEDEDFNKFKLRVQFIDAEMAVDDEWCNVDNPQYSINVLTVYDNYLNEYNTWILRNPKWCSSDLTFNDEYEERIVKYHIFDDEKEMYKDYLSWHRQNRPDVFTGWNIEDFDIPYIVNRIEQFVGDEVLTISPVHEIRKNVREQRGYSRMVHSYDIRGISVLDYLQLYRGKFGDNLGRYKLEDVGQHEIGRGKLEYEGSIKDFYKRDFKTFVEYNIQDVEVVVLIDKKCKFIDLARKICNIGLVEYEAIFRSSPYILGALGLQAHSIGKRIMTNNGNEIELNTGFTGAYVFPTKMGIYRGGTASVDLSSLYPSVMRTCNISPETKFGKITILDDDEGFIIRCPGKPPRQFNGSVKQLKGKLCISSNNVLYLHPDKQRGIIPLFLDRLYNLRQKTRNKGRNLDKKTVPLKEALNKLSGKQYDELKYKISEIEEMVQLYDNTQHAYKIFLNSIYGQMGNQHFPLFDLDNAEAVTITGQMIIKNSAQFVRDYFKNNFNHTEEVIYGGDTDSLMFGCESLTKHKLGEIPSEWTRDKINKVCKHLDKTLVTDLNEYCTNLTEDVIMSSVKTIEFKRETFCTESMFLAKKRYVMHVRDDEGKPVDKWKCTGVDIKKNELPDKIKDALKHIIFNSLTENWDGSKYMDELETIWDKFKNLSQDEVAYIKGYNTEKISTGFLKAEKGALASAKAALFYNQLIEHLKLTDKYDPIKVGDVLRFVYIKKNNPYGISVIGWTDSWPNEFNDMFQVDYVKMFTKSLMGPLKRIININGWPTLHPCNQVVTNIMDI